MDLLTGKAIYSKIICSRVMLSQAKKKGYTERALVIKQQLDKLENIKYQVIL